MFASHTVCGSPPVTTNHPACLPKRLPSPKKEEVSYESCWTNRRIPHLSLGPASHRWHYRCHCSPPQYQSLPPPMSVGRHLTVHTFYSSSPAHALIIFIILIIIYIYIGCLDEDSWLVSYLMYLGGWNRGTHTHTHTPRWCHLPAPAVFSLSSIEAIP